MNRFAYEIRCLVVGLALFLPVGAVQLSAAEVAAPQGAVILTIAGKINTWNRGAFDDVLDGYHKHHRFNFERAMTFDRAMLKALPQAQATAHPSITKKPTVFEGPRFTSILNAAGVDGAKSIALIALDGYTVELTPEDLNKQNLILAMSADGKPLGIGQHGLLWLVHSPAKGVKPSEEEFTKWGWAIFFIEVR